VSTRQLAALFAGVVMLPVVAGAADAGAADANPVYDTNCALCHQLRGAGLAGQFPRLAGRVDRLASDAAGRRYLVSVVLNGMAGRVVVDGAPLNGLMPGFPALADADVASVLSYLTQLSDAKGKRPARFSAKEVAAVRALGPLSPADVLARRAALAADGRVPQ
jgi:mono/diheme cytochrome c family protein